MHRGGGGGGAMTFHDYGYLLPEFFKSYPVPVSEWNFQLYTLPRSLAFFLGFFWRTGGGGQNLLLSKFFCYANFSIVFKPFLFFEGGGGRLREKTAVSRTMYQNTEMSCFQRKRREIGTAVTLSLPRRGAGSH